MIEVPTTYTTFWSAERNVFIVIGVLIAALVIVGTIIYFVSSSAAPAFPNASDEWSVDDKKKALEDLHATARQQGVSRLSDAEKMRIIQSIQNGQTQ